MIEHCAWYLSVGSMLHGQYRIDEALGSGGFGITYRGTDCRFGLRVAIKEFYPYGYAARDPMISPDVLANTDDKSRSVYNSGKNRFLEEAKKLAQCDRIVSVVGVRDYFEENNTAYIVMEFLDGETLKQCLEREKRLEPQWLCGLVLPLLRDLEKVHALGLLHRDISPDNLMLSPDGRLRLMDFGAARNYVIDESKSMTVMLKHGYAPFEQYTRHGDQGPWTDVYAIGATLYACLTGRVPEYAPDRVLEDKLQPLSRFNCPVTAGVERVIMKSLNVQARMRYQSAEEMADALEAALGIRSSTEKRAVTADDGPAIGRPIYSDAGTTELGNTDIAVAKTTVMDCPETENRTNSTAAMPSDSVPANTAADGYGRTARDASGGAQQHMNPPAGISSGQAEENRAPGRKKGILAKGVWIAALLCVAAGIAGMRYYRANKADDTAIPDGNADEYVQIMDDAGTTVAPQYTIVPGPALRSEAEYRLDGYEVNHPEHYQYRELADGMYEITGYAGEADKLCLPAEYQSRRVVAIGDQAFVNHSGITGVVIPEGIERIGNRAFQGCGNLASVHIGQTVKELGENPFSRCDGIVDFLVDGRNGDVGYKDGFLISIQDKRIVAGFGHEGELLIPEGIEIIGGSAFESNAGIEQAVIPEGVVSVGRYSFYNCTSLRSVKLPESLEEIGNMAFISTYETGNASPVALISKPTMRMQILLQLADMDYRTDEGQKE